MKPFLFVLGRTPALSRAELGHFCDEVLYDEAKALMIGENLRFENPRDLPRRAEQLFLDRLGGVVRMGAVLGEFFGSNQLSEAIVRHVQNVKKDGKIHLGISVWGGGKHLVRELGESVKADLREQYDQNCRVVNKNGKNLTSAQVFNERLLRKDGGFEFLVWKRDNSFLLAQTVGTQNLYNYELRDRRKPFRDSKMGMLPPKLAQILINLAQPARDETVIDPFCGSGTINAEAAIMGYQTVGSDLNPAFVKGSEENFRFLAEKFRYDGAGGSFLVSDAVAFPPDKLSGVIATEGWLGHNFEERPTPGEVRANAASVLQLWEQMFDHLQHSEIRRLSFCLPAWNTNAGTVSISEKLFAKLQQTSYSPTALFDGKNTFLYQRPGAFVAREICVVERRD